ncbi:MAG: isoleucine--tRNA ligase [Cellvibrionales bacterium]|nr:isoleucine--tRNA ligase [Cellvibrionales bacterium]
MSEDKKNQYKQTLNLPKTAFAMKANLAQREPQRLKAWDKADVYGQIRKKFAGRETFILHDGPPYANGEIHLGHSVNKILKDIIIKSKTLQGFDAPYVPGWDCHGLPIEHKVETKVGKAGVKVDYKTFRQKCREYATRQVDGQRKGFVRLGVLGDWQNPYLTMNFKTEADIVRSLGQIIDNGHLVRGFKPVYWSVVGGSALAEAEVEYQDKNSFSIDVAFAIDNQQGFADSIGGLEGEGDISVVIWTTTPWTLPANQAVSVHAELDYVVVECVVGDEGVKQRLVLAEALHESALQRYGVNEFTIVGRFKGEAIENVSLCHPFYERTVPIILGDHVTTEAGTGCVHTAPDHGVEDFVVSKKYGIETLNLVGDNGVYNENTERFAGQHVYKVDEPIIEVLKEHQRLLAVEKIRHSYPHCWRTKTPLIYRATPQWFIGMEQQGLLNSVKAAVEGVQWVPDWGRARIDGMLASSPDWCISRQRTWGVPITLFVHKVTQELHPNTVALIEQVAKRIEVDGIDVWFDLDAAELLGDDADDYTKVTDTLDVWFDSGVTHYSVLKNTPGLSFPADLYLEGSDQHRGWFQSSLKTSIAMNGTAPYKAVLTHGFVVDADGKKMSKSLGNIVAPQEVMNELGADVLRLWVAATDFSSEMSVSNEILKRVSDSYRRIRNTARFLLSNLEGFDPKTDLLPNDQLLLLDRWAITRAAELQEEILTAYNEYQLHTIYQKLHNFCVVDLGSIYLDIIKDRQYTTQADSVARRSAQTAMYHIIEAFTRWIAPILSFTADELNEHIPGERSENIFIEEVYAGLDNLLDDSQGEVALMQTLCEVKVAVNKAIEGERTNGTIGASLEAEVIIYAEQSLATQLLAIKDELRFVLMASAVTVVADQVAPDNAIATELDAMKLVINKSEHEKCARCWHHREEVGTIEAHPELCQRCVDNVDGDGEERLYA